MIPDHLPAFGINCETEDELVSFCHRVIQNGTAIQVPDAEHRLVRWEVTEGVHIWMYVNPANEVESLFPIYYPVSSHDLEVERLIEAEGEDHENLLVEGWVLEDNDGTSADKLNSPDSKEASEAPSERRYKLPFVCVDAPLYVEELTGAGRTSFQLMGVSRKPKLHVDRETFEQEQRAWGSGNDIQARTVIPSDVLNLDVDPFFEDVPVRPYVYLTGIVRETHVVSESCYDTPFLHVKVDTNGMHLDVLIGERAVPTTPESGNVLEGHFILLGMKKPRGGAPL